MSTPSAASSDDRTSATSESSRGRIRGPASTSVTCVPRRANAWPSSHPMLPPPITSSRSGRIVRDHTESDVRTSTLVIPGMSGMTGAEPVERIACRNLTSEPLTTREVGPVNSPAPWTTVTPARRRSSGESMGSIVAIDSRTCAIAAAKSGSSTPARWARDSSALLGTHPVQRQSPPVRALSTSRTSDPRPAAVFAATIPAVPPPSTRRSQSFGWSVSESEVQSTGVTISSCRRGRAVAPGRAVERLGPDQVRGDPQAARGPP